MRAGLSIHGIEELGDVHDHLSSLTNHELFALQSRQMLGRSWPRGSDQVGDVLLAEGHAQQRAARFLDPKVCAQFQKCDTYSFVEAEVQEAGAAQQEAIPLLQIVLMKLFEDGLGSICGNAVESCPTHGADAAIVVSLALKAGLAKRQRRKFGNRPRREHRHRDTLVARVSACDARNACQQNVSIAGERGVAQDYRVAFVVGQYQRANQECELRGGKPRQSLEPAQSVKIGFTGSTSFMQNCTVQTLTIRARNRIEEAKCLLYNKFFVLWRTLISRAVCSGRRHQPPTARQDKLGRSFPNSASLSLLKIPSEPEFERLRELLSN